MVRIDVTILCMALTSGISSSSFAIGDANEPNNTPAQATPLIVGTMPTAPVRISALDPGASSPDEDWFRWTSLPHEAYTVSLDSASRAAFGFVLTIYNDSLQQVATVTSPGNLHRIRIGIRGADAPYFYARVTTLVPNLDPEYWISVSRLTVANDPQEPNSSWQTATMLNIHELPPPVVHGVLYAPPGQMGLDEDWFRFSAPSGRVLDVELRPAQGLPQVDWFVMDANGPVALPITWDTSREPNGTTVLRSVVVAPITAEYFVRVVNKLSVVEISHYSLMILPAHWQTMLTPSGGLTIEPPLLAADSGELWGVAPTNSPGVYALKRLDPTTGTSSIMAPAIAGQITDLELLPNGELLMVVNGHIQRYHVDPTVYRGLVGNGIIQQAAAVAAHDQWLYIGDNNEGSLWRVSIWSLTNPLAYQRIVDHGWSRMIDFEVDATGDIVALVALGAGEQYALYRIQPTTGVKQSIGGEVYLRAGQYIALDEEGGVYLWHRPDCCTERLVRIDIDSGAVTATYTLEPLALEFVYPLFAGPSRQLYLYGYRDREAPTLYRHPSKEHGLTHPFTLFKDADRDGIPDSREAYPAPSHSSNRHLPDSDGDGLNDGTEDRNADGARNSGETSTRSADTDNDHIDDGVEIFFLGSDPLSAASPSQPHVRTDSDNDRLPDVIDPASLDPDADDDGISDGYEAVQLSVMAALNASVKPPLGDLSGDGFVSNLDALLAQGIFVGRLLPQQAKAAQGDVEMDGNISNRDALIIHAKFLANLAYLPFLVSVW